MENSLKIKFILVGIILAFIGISACVGSPAGRSITDIQDVDWKLAEVRSSSGVIRIDRTRPGTDGIYTIRFAENRISGSAAPNRYTAPYTSREGNILSIGVAASTMMAPLFENENLREHVYFDYLSRVNRWIMQNGNLHLYTSAENGTQVILIFVR